MSHEICTPLNGVTGMLNLLAHTELNEKQRHYVRVAESSAETLLSLISQLLDYSAIEAGRLALKREKFNLHALLEEVAETLVQQARCKGLTLRRRVSSDVPQWAVGDPERIRQVLASLAGNAIKFSARGEVAIRADVVRQADGADLVRFRIRDTGIGIPRERLESLFDAFSQVDASTTRKYGGAGLGLSICKQLVELMGGRIEVESQLHQGSTFACIIPLATADDDGQPPAGEMAGSDRRTARQPATELAEPPLNLQMLRDRCLGDSKMMARVLRVFSDAARGVVEQIQTAVAAADAVVAARLTCSLRDAAESVSAAGATQLAAEIETLSRSGRLAEAQDHLDRLESEMTRCLQHVEQTLHDLSAH
jgi:HPt (histidine-containing phosphotransfer) domain-containing protein